MDPFSAEGELTNLHTAFHTAQHAAVLAYDVTTLSEANVPFARILQLRSRIALGEYDAVVAECDKDLKAKGENAVDLQAVMMFAAYSKAAAKGGASSGVEPAEKLAAEQGGNLTVQLLAGTVLAREGKDKEVLALLAGHQGSLDAVALIVQIHLAMNRLDLAQQEVRKARSWAQDHILVNLAESWVGLREGGPKYQPAFYVYEELATTPATLSAATNTTTLLSQAICELHLGRLPEAEAALATALEQAPEDPDVLANAVVLNTVAGKRKEAEELKARLEKVNPSHALVVGLKEKKEAFESAKAKYSPVFEVKG